MRTRRAGNLLEIHGNETAPVNAQTHLLASHGEIPVRWRLPLILKEYSCAEAETLYRDMNQMFGGRALVAEAGNLLGAQTQEPGDSHDQGKESALAQRSTYRNCGSASAVRCITASTASWDEISGVAGCGGAGSAGILSGSLVFLPISAPVVWRWLPLERRSVAEP